MLVRRVLLNLVLSSGSLAVYRYDGQHLKPRFLNSSALAPDSGNGSTGQHVATFDGPSETLPTTSPSSRNISSPGAFVDSRCVVFETETSTVTSTISSTFSGYTSFYTVSVTVISKVTVEARTSGSALVLRSQLPSFVSTNSLATSVPTELSNPPILSPAPIITALANSTSPDPGTQSGYDLDANSTLQTVCPDSCGSCSTLVVTATFTRILSNAVAGIALKPTTDTIVIMQTMTNPPVVQEPVNEIVGKGQTSDTQQGVSPDGDEVNTEVINLVKQSTPSKPLAAQVTVPPPGTNLAPEDPRATFRPKAKATDRSSAPLYDANLDRQNRQSTPAWKADPPRRTSNPTSTGAPNGLGREKPQVMSILEDIWDETVLPSGKAKRPSIVSILEEISDETVLPNGREERPQIVSATKEISGETALSSRRQETPPIASILEEISKETILPSGRQEKSPIVSTAKDIPKDPIIPNGQQEKPPTVSILEEISEEPVLPSEGQEKSPLVSILEEISDETSPPSRKTTLPPTGGFVPKSSQVSAASKTNPPARATGVSQLTVVPETSTRSDAATAESTALISDSRVLPDGRLVVTVGAEAVTIPSGVSSFVVTPSSGAVPVTLTGINPPIASISGSSSGPRVLPDGRLVVTIGAEAVTVPPGAASLVITPSAGAAPVTLIGVNPPIASVVGSISNPLFLPDGRVVITIGAEAVTIPPGATSLVITPSAGAAPVTLTGINPPNPSTGNPISDLGLLPDGNVIITVGAEAVTIPSGGTPLVIAPSPGAAPVTLTGINQAPASILSSISDSRLLPDGGIVVTIDAEVITIPPGVTSVITPSSGTPITLTGINVPTASTVVSISDSRLLSNSGTVVTIDGEVITIPPGVTSVITPLSGAPVTFTGANAPTASTVVSISDSQLLPDGSIVVTIDAEVVTIPPGAPSLIITPSSGAAPVTIVPLPSAVTSSDSMDTSLAPDLQSVGGPAVAIISADSAAAATGTSLRLDSGSPGGNGGGDTPTSARRTTANDPDSTTSITRSGSQQGSIAPGETPSAPTTALPPTVDDGAARLGSTNLFPVYVLAALVVLIT